MLAYSVIDNKVKTEQALEIAQKSYEEQKLLQKQQEEERRQELERIAKLSFYQRLSEGLDVNVLVIGDSIGEQSWPSLLGATLQQQYGSSVKITNVSMGGNSSYAGYVRTMALSDNVEYNLAIICYGQNDGNTDFSLYYETILRAITKKYAKCSIISILESSQRSYTEKIRTIQSLAEHYGVLVADMIDAFTSGDYGEYDSLSSDGVHLNDEGNNVYSYILKNIILEAVEKNVVYNTESIEVVNDEVTDFDSFVWYDVSKFEKIGTTYTLTLDNSIDNTILGIDYTFVSQQNQCYIYCDEIQYAAPTVFFNYDFSQRHILMVGKDCNIEKTIKITFGDATQANGFKGICLSRINNE